MTIPLLPEKHVRNGESLLGLGAIVLSLLERGPKDLDAIWEEIKEQDAVKSRINGSVTLDRIVIAIDLLFALGAVDLTSKGSVAHASR